MAGGAETIELFKALKIKWDAADLKGNGIAAYRVGEIEPKKPRPYVTLAPLSESPIAVTNKGKYELVVFEVGAVVDAFEECSVYGKLVQNATEGQESSIDMSPSSMRLLHAKRTGGRYEEIQNFWVYWQEFSCKVAR